MKQRNTHFIPSASISPEKSNLNSIFQGSSFLTDNRLIWNSTRLNTRSASIITQNDATFQFFDLELLIFSFSKGNCGLFFLARKFRSRKYLIRDLFISSDLTVERFMYQRVSKRRDAPARSRCWTRSLTNQLFSPWRGHARRCLFSYVFSLELLRNVYRDEVRRHRDAATDSSRWNSTYYFSVDDKYFRCSSSSMLCVQQSLPLFLKYHSNFVSSK